VSLKLLLLIQGALNVDFDDPVALALSGRLCFDISTLLRETCRISADNQDLNIVGNVLKESPKTQSGPSIVSSQPDVLSAEAPQAEPIGPLIYFLVPLMLLLSSADGLAWPFAL